MIFRSTHDVCWTIKRFSSACSDNSDMYCSILKRLAIIVLKSQVTNLLIYVVKLYVFIIKLHNQIYVGISELEYLHNMSFYQLFNLSIRKYKYLIWFDNGICRKNLNQNNIQIVGSKNCYQIILMNNTFYVIIYQSATISSLIS